MIIDIINKILVWLGLARIARYNHPAVRLEEKYVETIHADINFNYKEKEIIIESVMEWNRFCNGFLILNLVFDFHPDNTYLKTNRVVIRLASSKDKVIEAYELKHNSIIMGLCTFNKKIGIDIYLVKNRLYNKQNWRVVTLHEIGHFLGLGHINGPSIMQKFNCIELKTMNKLDAIEFARVHKIDFNNLAYSF